MRAGELDIGWVIYNKPLDLTHGDLVRMATKIRENRRMLPI
jgi:hypothetical protein